MTASDRVEVPLEFELEENGRLQLLEKRQGENRYEFGSLIILNPEINQTPGAIDSLAKLLDYSKNKNCR